MSNLPNPLLFQDFKLILNDTFKEDNKPTTSPTYIYSKLVKEKHLRPLGLHYRLFSKDFLRYSNSSNVFNKFFYYSDYYDSIAIVLKDGEEIKTVLHHRTTDKEGNIIKWKTNGCKKYLQTNFKKDDEVIFIVYGIAEILICEILELSYIAFQSDSITKTLKNHNQWIEQIKPQLQNKVIVLLLDNDSSCRDTINPIKEELEPHHNIIVPLEMQDLLKEKDKQGNDYYFEIDDNYDFKDYCNDFSNIYFDYYILEDKRKELKEEIRNIIDKTIARTVSNGK